jgi:hypothetical protein
LLEDLAATTSFTSTGASGRSVIVVKDGQSVSAAWPDVAPAASQADLAVEGGHEVGPDPLPACARAVAITALEQRSILVIKGVARPQFSGQPVFVTYEPTGARVIATPVVQGDGSYQAGIPLPRGPLARSSDARFTAHIGGADSKAIKRTRRLVASAVDYADGKIRVAGLIRRPMPGERVEVTQGDSCGDYRTVGSVRVDSSGRFRGAVAFRSAKDAIAVRLKARVRGDEGGSFMTFSIAVPISLN